MPGRLAHGNDACQPARSSASNDRDADNCEGRASDNQQAFAAKDGIDCERAPLMAGNVSR
jgi:hypothetical protein